MSRILKRPKKVDHQLGEGNTARHERERERDYNRPISALEFCIARTISPLNRDYSIDSSREKKTLSLSVGVKGMQWLCSRSRIMSPSLVSWILLSLLLSSSFVSAAWQEISDYTDCGSTNFKTEKILVDFNENSYWLNISVQGDFPRQVLDYSTVTNLASTPPHSLS